MRRTHKLSLAQQKAELTALLEDARKLSFDETLIAKYTMQLKKVEDEIVRVYKKGITFRKEIKMEDKKQNGI